MVGTEEIVSRTVIQPKVVRALARAAHKKLDPNAKKVESYRLEEDLGLKKDPRSALKEPFNDICREEYGGYTIFYTECVLLKLVKDAVELVYRKANRRDK